MNEQSIIATDPDELVKWRSAASSVAASCFVVILILIAARGIRQDVPFTSARATNLTIYVNNVK